MDLESQIGRIIRKEYEFVIDHDEGRSSAAAHDIWNLIKDKLLPLYRGDS